MHDYQTHVITNNNKLIKGKYLIFYRPIDAINGIDLNVSNIYIYYKTFTLNAPSSGKILYKVYVCNIYIFT